MIDCKLILSAVAKPDLWEQILLSLTTESDLYINGVLETLLMVGITAVFSYFFGFIIASVLYITAPTGTRPMHALNAVLGWIVNMGRSIPFIILIVVLRPFTRFMIGTTIGTKGVIIPLVIAATPMVARLLQSSFEEVEPGLVESAISMGANSFEVISKVLVPEAMPSILRGVSLAIISIIGTTAMTGTVGGGGLGKVAMDYGYTRYRFDVLIITLIILIVLVQMIQSICTLLASVVDKRKK